MVEGDGSGDVLREVCTASCRPVSAFTWFLVLSNLLLTISSQIKFIVSELPGICKRDIGAVSDQQCSLSTSVHYLFCLNL